ncbi:MAG: hypothetical protein ABIL09_20525, partial [Gemmatimonadota bacterium]
RLAELAAAIDSLSSETARLSRAVEALAAAGSRPDWAAIGSLAAAVGAAIAAITMAAVTWRHSRTRPLFSKVRAQESGGFSFVVTNSGPDSFHVEGITMGPRFQLAEVSTEILIGGQNLHLPPVTLGPHDSATVYLVDAVVAGPDLQPEMALSRNRVLRLHTSLRRRPFTLRLPLQPIAGGDQRD